MELILYLGLEPPAYSSKEVVHCPLIQIIPVPHTHPEVRAVFSELFQYTHLIFTSKTAVSIFYHYLSLFGWGLNIVQDKIIIAVGSATARLLKENQAFQVIVAAKETAEGVVEELMHLSLDKACVMWPHSAKARSVILDFLQQQRISHAHLVLYDTMTLRPDPIPSLEAFKEIVFTSPSTVDAFMEIFGKFPQHSKLTCIGPITESYLNHFL